MLQHQRLGLFLVYKTSQNHLTVYFTDCSWNHVKLYIYICFHWKHKKKHIWFLFQLCSQILVHSSWIRGGEWDLPMMEISTLLDSEALLGKTAFAECDLLVAMHGVEQITLLLNWGLLLQSLLRSFPCKSSYLVCVVFLANSFLL